MQLPVGYFPEGCASILWKSAEYASEAAEAMGLTAQRLHELGLVDQIVSEPLGGGHRDHDAIADSLKASLIENLERLTSKNEETLMAERYQRLMSYGFSG